MIESKTCVSDWTKSTGKLSTNPKKSFLPNQNQFFDNMKRIKQAILGKNSSPITTRNNKKMNKAEKESAVESPRSVPVKSDEREKVNDRTDASAKPRTEFEELIEVIKVGAEITKIYVNLWFLIIFLHLKKTDLLEDELSSNSFFKIISAFFKLRVSLWFPVYIH